MAAGTSHTPTIVCTSDPLADLGHSTINDECNYRCYIFSISVYPLRYYSNPDTMRLLVTIRVEGLVSPLIVDHCLEISSSLESELLLSKRGVGGEVRHVSNSE